MEDVESSSLKTSNAVSSLKVLLIKPMHRPKKKAVLLAISSQTLCELFSTVTLIADFYYAAKTILITHFTSKKNLTAERFKFFCTNAIDSDKTHDHWITRLRAKVNDCKFDRMGDDEAIKLVMTLHTS